MITRWDIYRRRISDERQRILEYLRSLAQEPAQDPALAAELQERGLHLRQPNSVDVEENIVDRQLGGPVPDLCPGNPSLMQFRGASST